MKRAGPSRRCASSGVLAAGLAIALASPVAATSIQLKPAGPWTVEYEDQSCTLKRPMSGVKEAYQLSLESPPFRSTIKITIKHKTEIYVPAYGKLTVSIDGKENISKSRFSFYRSSDDESVHTYQMNYLESGIDRLTKTLRLSGGENNDFEIEIPNFQKAISAFAMCKTDLYRSLGIDPAFVASIAVSSEGSVMNVVRTPTSSMDFRILYWVNSNGSVDRCRLIKPSGFGLFDRSVCATLERKARFKPAQDSVGHAIVAPRYEDVHIKTGANGFQSVVSQ